MLLGAAVLLGGSTHVLGSVATDSRTVAPPLIHSRTSWGAAEPEWEAEVLDDAPTYIVVHHTDTRNVDDDSRAHAFALSRAIQRYHMEHNGWSDTGQQLTISRGGHIMEGRNGSLAAIRSGQHLVGAQARDHNPVAIGIENEGRYHSTEPPPELYTSLVEVCAWLCSVYGRDASAIVGHRDLVDTSCPGEELYAMLPRLREDVAAQMWTDAPLP